MSEAWLALAAVFHPAAAGGETGVSGGGAKAGAAGATTEFLVADAVLRINGMTADALA